MIRVTGSAALSSGDRLCLALAAREGAAALTADPSRLRVADAIGARIEIIR
jgi:PIN domain nuclease of toxin-antitoxin system